MLETIPCLTQFHITSAIGRVDAAEYYQILLLSTRDRVDQIISEMAAFDTCDTLFTLEKPLDPDEASTDPRRRRLAAMVEEDREKLRDLETKTILRHPEERFDELSQEVSQLSQSLMKDQTVRSLRALLTSESSSMDKYNSWSQSLVAALGDFHGRHSSFREIYLPILQGVTLVFEGLDALACRKRRMDNSGSAIGRFDDIRWMEGSLPRLPEDVFHSGQVLGSER